MAATIGKSCCRMLHCINGIKHLQLHYPTVSGGQSFTVLKDAHRSTWYRSFFRTDQTSSDQSETSKYPENTSDSSLTKPKKPANVFLLYLQTVQGDIKQANPGFKRQQILTEAARQWRELNPEEKSRIAMERKELYEKYKLEKMIYLENITPEQIKEEEREKERVEIKKLKKARKELGMPKRPWSSYKWFLSEKFAERSDEAVHSYFKQTKDMWNTLSDHEKEVYYEKHRESQKEYQVNMANWEESMIEAGRFDVVRKSTLNKLRQADGKKVESKKKNKVIEKNIRI